MSRIPQPPDPKDEGCTIARLKQWLASLPPEFDSAKLEGFVGPFPCNPKRVIAYRYKDGGGGIAVNPMGTHYSDEWADGVEIVSVLD